MKKNNKGVATVVVVVIVLLVLIIIICCCCGGGFSSSSGGSSSSNNSNSVSSSSNIAENISNESNAKESIKPEEIKEEEVSELEPEPKSDPEPEPEPDSEPEPEPELREYELNKSGNDLVIAFFKLMEDENLTMDEVFKNARINNMCINKYESDEDSNIMYCEISAELGKTREYSKSRDYSGIYYIELQYYRNKPRYSGFLRDDKGGSQGHISMF